MARITHDNTVMHRGIVPVSQLPPDSWKLSVRAATTANITISTALNNADVLDGVTLATGDRVLVKNQSTGSQNGIYIVGTSPARAEDYDVQADVLGSVVVVQEGTTNADTAWLCTTNAPITVGTTALVYAAFGAGSGSGIIVEEVDGSPTGTITTLKFPNGTLGIVGAVATYTDAGGSAQFDVDGTKYRFPTGKDTLAQLNPADGSEATLLMSGGFVELYVEGTAAATGIIEIDGSVGDVTISASNDVSLLADQVILSVTTKVQMVGGNGVVIPILAADPSAGNSTDGQLYYNSATDKFMGRANGVWVALH